MNKAEQKLANYLSKKYCYITGNGTTAIYLILKSLSNNKKICYPAITCTNPVNAAVYSNYKPVFCDINLKDYTMDIQSLKDIIRLEQPSVIVPTHIYGHVCDMDSIIEIANKNDVFVLEDAAQAFGATYKGRRVGSFGDASVVSFGHTKILECGGGGAVITDDIKLYSNVRELGEQLQEIPVDYDFLIESYRSLYYKIYELIKIDDSYWNLMNSLQYNFMNTFIYKVPRGLTKNIFEKINNLDDILAKREIRKQIYSNHLDKKLCEIPTTLKGSTTWRYSFLYEGNRDKLLENVREDDVDISSWYPALHNMYFSNQKIKLKNAEYLDKHIVNMWVNPETSINQIKNNITVINSYLDCLE